MQIDVKQLSTEQIDAMIEALALERTARTDPIKDVEAGTSVQATMNPIWKAEVVGGAPNLGFSLQNRGKGWTHFVFNRQCLADLTAYFTRILLGGYLETGATEAGKQSRVAPITSAGSNRVN
jgi:hypothetical protein